MADDLTEKSAVDPKELRAEVKKAAARAPKWVSADPPYPVKAEYSHRKNAEKERETKQSDVQDESVLETTVDKTS